MPIIDIRDPVNLSDQNSADSLLGRAINGELAAAAPAREEDPKPTSSFGEGFGASLRMGMIQSITNSLSRNGINPFGVLGDTLNFKADESFNPFKYIEEQSKDGGVFGSPSRRELAYRMTELGQFDDVKSQEEFDHQYMIGEQFMRDASALSGAGMLAKSAGFATNMLGDPSNLIPLGGALAVAGKVGKAAVRSEMLAKTLAGASVAATAAIAIKKAQDAMTPVANVPGLEDEAITGLVSAAFGGIIGAATSEAISRPFLTGVEGRKLQDVRNGFARAMSNPQSRSARSPVGAAGPKDPAFAKGPAEAAEGFGEFLENAQAENRAHLQEALDGPLVQDKPVTVLTTGNDDQAKLLTALRKRYEEAGLRLHVSEHGAAADLRMSKAAEAALNISGEAIEASAAELGKTKGGAYLMKIGEWYGNIVSWLPGSSPASRMQKSTLGLLRETQRTLFGSMRTVAAGSAENPTKYNVGANAEGLKDIYHAESGRVTVGIRKDRGEAGRNGIDKDRFDSELVDNLIAKDDAARGYGDAPKASNPHVQSAADRVSAYMLKFRDRLEEVGLLEMGPQGLRAAQDELSKITAVRDAIQKRLDNDPFETREAQTATNKVALKQRREALREAKKEGRTLGRIAIKAIRAAGRSNTNVKAGVEAARRSGDPGVMQELSRIARERMARVGPPKPADAGESWNQLNSRDARDAVVNMKPEDFPMEVQYELSKALGSNAVPKNRATRWELYRKAIGQAARSDPNVVSRILESRGVAPLRDATTRPALAETDAPTASATLEQRVGQNAEQTRAVVDQSQEPLVTQVFDDTDAELLKRAINDIPDNELPASVREVKDEFSGRLAEAQRKKIRQSDDAYDRSAAFYNDIQRLKAEIASDAAKFPKQHRRHLERRLKRAERATAKQAAKVAEYEKAVKAQDGYFSMMYDVDRIKANPSGFIRAVADGLGIADMTVNGKRISADQMKLRPEVIEALGDDTMILAARLRELDGGDSVPMTREQALAEVPNITVGELPDTIREAYLKRLQQFYTDTAQAVHDKITHFGDIMPEAWDASSNALKARTLSIPKSIVKDYLVRDIDTLMALYHHRVGGRVAVARAIQTNERLSGLVTPDGRPVKTGDDLEAALSFALDSMSGIQARAEAMGNTAAKQSALPAIEKTKQMVQRDLISRMRLLEGAAAAPGGKGLDSEVGAFLTRSALNWNYSTMMGSASIPNITDTGALIVQAMFGRAVRQRLAEAVRTLGGYAARDLEAVGFGLDHQSRVMALGDLPDVSTTTKGGGYGSGRTRRVSRTIDVGAQATSRFVGKASGLAWLTNTLRKTFAGVKIDMAMQDSRRILKMQALIDDGMNPDEAIRRVGLSKYEAGRLNGLGLNAKNARILHEQTYKHGVLDDGRKVSEAMSFDEYLAYKKRVHPEMMSWDNTKPVRDVLDTVTSQINQEVNRFDLLTPGVSDKPILNDKNHWKLINQFQSFAYAYVNQRVIPMSQMPATHQLAYLMTTMGLSMMADAVQNHLAGRRSIDETIKMLMTAKGAAGLVYAAWNRSGLSGWLTRPLAITDAMGVGISPGMLLENTVGSGAARHITRDRAVTSLMGPTASQIGRVVQTGTDVLNLKADRWTAYNGAKLTPTNNLIWFRLLHYGTGLPVAPEWILEKSK